MNEAKKKGKKCLACLLVLLFVIGTTIAPAAVAQEDGEINGMLKEIDDDPIINSFIYNRMLEYDNPKLKPNRGIEAVKIVVIEGHWWSGNKEVKTFYVVRNDDKKALPEDKINIIDDYYEGDDGSLWTFYPKKGHTIDALDMLLNYELTVSNVIHMGIRAILVNKDNVPGITEIITNSPWASGYLPDGAENFLEWFESHH